VGLHREELRRPKEDGGEVMAENKTRATGASVTAFIGAIPDPVRQVDARALVKLMKAASGEKPKMWGPSIIGFGSTHYVYDTGREGDMPLVGFSPRKAATVLYGMKGFRGSEALLARLGRHTEGGGCIYVRELADVDRKVLEEIVARSVAARRAKPTRAHP
jgi:hypothetical protein